MAYSCSTTNVSRYHVDKTMPEFIAYLVSGLLIEVSVELIAMATVDGREMMGDLLIAFACKGRPQFLKPLRLCVWRMSRAGRTIYR